MKAFVRTRFGPPEVLRLEEVYRPVPDVVEAVDKNVTQLKPGDEVFGVALWGLAEYTRARPVRLALKPPSTSFEDAVAIPLLR
jgi:NADPH:quinone reductase-like Zn-dependent oxidoreductase